MKQGSLAHRSRMRHPRKTGNFIRNQTFESNGGDVKIRGNPQQIIDKYLGMARDAYASGDRVAAEHYFQHAEHYHRLSHHVSVSDQRDRQPPNGSSVDLSPQADDQRSEDAESGFDNENQNDSLLPIGQMPHQDNQEDEYIEQKPDGMMLPPSLINPTAFVQPPMAAPSVAAISEEILPEVSQKTTLRRGRQKLTLPSSPGEPPLATEK